ncbi:MAG TPA: hypothetical protein VFV84_11565 [Burkholderiales bacterium]|nr:hypothetical protein [Burkholderiales bacterium]
MMRPFLLISLLACAVLAHAQIRTLPADAQRGYLRHLQDMIVQIDGRTARLSLGAQVRDAHNRIVVPAAIPPGSLVKYTVNPQGEVSAVWILSAQEAAR